MQNPLAGHTNTYHTYGLDDALEGIASAGYTHVELSAVPGWTTIAVLLALMNGFVIMLLSMLGEYVVRTLNAVSAVTTYHVARRVSS